MQELSRKWNQEMKFSQDLTEVNEYTEILKAIEATLAGGKAVYFSFFYLCPAPVWQIHRVDSRKQLIMIRESWMDAQYHKQQPKSYVGQMAHFKVGMDDYMKEKNCPNKIKLVFFNEDFEVLNNALVIETIVEKEITKVVKEIEYRERRDKTAVKLDDLEQYFRHLSGKMPAHVSAPIKEFLEKARAWFLK